MLQGKKNENQCRLCTSTEEGQHNIFDANYTSKNLPMKIKECLPVNVTEDDPYPKLICRKCLDLLDKFYEFRKTSVRAEAAFESALKTAVAPSFPLEPECCLQEVDTGDVQNADNGQPIESSKSALMQSIHKTVPRIEGLKDLTILPVSSDGEDYKINGSDNMVEIPSSFSNENKKSRFDKLKIGEPGPDDYVLMKEESFSIDNKKLTQANIEFLRQEKDNDILLSQKRRREVLPPMWDVYERLGKESSVVIQRRYIVNKAAFPCSLCNKCFTVTQGHQREGKSEESSGDEATGIHFFSCHECGKVFPRRSSLKRHQLMHNELFQMFTCPLCGKTFGRKEHLSRHMLSHTGGRPYTCDICSKPFVRKEHLDRHRLSHMNNLSTEKQGSESASGSPDTSAAPSDDSGTTIDRPYPCDICHQSFVGSDQLLRHQKRMHNIGADGTELLKNHICTICLKSFSRKEHLVRHQKIHQRDFLLAAGSLPSMAISSLVPQVFKNDIGNGTINLDSLNFLKSENIDLTIDNSNQTVFNGHTDNFKMEESPNIKHEKDEIKEKQENLVYDNLFDGANHSIDGDNSVSVPDSELSSNGPTPVQTPPVPTLLEQTPPLPNIPLPTKPVPVTPVIKHACPVCVDKTFSTRSHLIRHFKNAHPDQPLSLALASPKVIKNVEDVQNEAYKNNMPTNGRHWCKYCEKSFGRRYHLVRHMKVHGPEEEVKPFRCSACNTSFVSHELFQSHVCNPQAGETVNPSRTKPAKRDKRKRSKGFYECVTCGINFSKKKLLRRHEENVHNKTMEVLAQMEGDYDI